MRALALRAVEHLLAQTLVEVTHPADWKRDGFPLPVKRMAPSPDGSVTQNYRPIVVLEWVNDKLLAAAKPPADKPTDDLDDLFGEAP